MLSLQTRLPGWQARANHSVTVCAGGILSARSVLKGGEEPEILDWEFPPPLLFVSWEI